MFSSFLSFLTRFWSFHRISGLATVEKRAKEGNSKMENGKGKVSSWWTSAVRSRTHIEGIIGTHIEGIISQVPRNPGFILMRPVWYSKMQSWAKKGLGLKKKRLCQPLI